MSDYMPTTAEMREYVEMGGEQAPWHQPTPEIDASRAAAFDRWLAATVATAKADALKDAALSGLFGTNAQTRLLEMSNEIRGGNK